MHAPSRDAGLTRTRASTPASIAAAALLVGLVLVNVYRAYTQSVVYDEAFTYLAFLSGPLGLVFTEFTANNHVLFSLLARLSTGAFGVSELALRLPTVLAGIMYFITVFALCRLVFGHGLVSFITVAALSLNPFILDFLSAARGYGLALALFTVALYQLTRLLVQDHVACDSRWLAPSLALALCVCANLAFLPPAAALACAALMTGAVGEYAERRVVPAAALRRAALWLALPGVVVASAFLAVPLSHATSDHFFFGASTLGQTITSLVEPSLRHDAGAWPISAPEVPPAALSRAVAWGVVVPTMLVAAGVACVSMIRTVRMGPEGRWDLLDRFLALVGGTTALTLLLLVCAHASLDVPYPFARTGLYFIPLVVLAMAALAQKLNRSAKSLQRALAGVILVALGLSIGRFAATFTVTYYYEWRYDAGSRAIFDLITGWPRAADSDVITVAASRWLFSPSLNFYRVTRRDAGIEPVDDGWEPGQRDYAFFVVSPADLERAQRVGNPVYVDPVSGAVLLLSRR